jgi:hypothetical protein
MKATSRYVERSEEFKTLSNQCLFTSHEVQEDVRCCSRERVSADQDL